MIWSRTTLATRVISFFNVTICKPSYVSYKKSLSDAYKKKALINQNHCNSANRLNPGNRQAAEIVNNREFATNSNTEKKRLRSSNKKQLKIQRRQTKVLQIKRIVFEA